MKALKLVVAVLAFQLVGLGAAQAEGTKRPDTTVEPVVVLLPY